MTDKQVIERMKLKLADAEKNIPNYTGAILDAQMYRIALKALENHSYKEIVTRPKGEWKIDKMPFGYTVFSCECGFAMCMDDEHIDTERLNFCSNCGTDMRKDNQENERI